MTALPIGAQWRRGGRKSSAQSAPRSQAAPPRLRRAIRRRPARAADGNRFAGSVHLPSRIAKTMAMSDLVEEGDATTVDAEARERALDVGGSFLVQAPAGSGKTELLIQRFLALLSHVDRPDRVVAMTFTRKAAAEMRDRVTKALAEAEANKPIDDALEIETRALARRAL